MKLFRGIQDRAKPESFMLIVILPNSAGPIRNAVKHWGDVRFGTLSVSVYLLDLNFPGFRCDDPMSSTGEVHGCQQSVLEQRSFEVRFDSFAVFFSQLQT